MGKMKYRKLPGQRICPDQFWNTAPGTIGGGNVPSVPADEIYDGPFRVLTMVDSKHQQKLAYEVPDHTLPAPRILALL